VAAGAMLIFGGDMNGFMKTLVFIVLVLAFVIAAQNMLTAITGTGTVIAQSLLGIEITSQLSKS
jgi:type IV secretory pathway VirB2 component (pilin)